MLIMMTSAVQTSIHATSPLFGVGAGVADGAADAAAAAAAVAVPLSAALSWAYAGAAAAAKAKNKASMEISFFIVPLLERFSAGFAGADADHLLELENENLAVADFPGVGRFLDRLDDLLEHLALDGRFDLDLRQEVDDVFRASIKLGVTFLPPEPLDLG